MKKGDKTKTQKPKKTRVRCECGVLMKEGATRDDICSECERDCGIYLNKDRAWFG